MGICRHLFIKISIFKTFYLFFLAKDEKYALLTIVKSDKKNIIMKKSCHAFRVIFCSFMIMAMSLSLLAQRSMSLGDLKFVLPSADMQMASRTFDIKMATTGIAPSVFRTVGGVAFIQTAVPSFEINDLELSCSIINNRATVIINDTVYILPLEVWQLQSIVNFADATGNAAVTLYGDEESLIKYHKAFIDNLMGLRLLQVDLMLLNCRFFTDMMMFPALDGEYILSPNERYKYEHRVYRDAMMPAYMEYIINEQKVRVDYDNYVVSGRIDPDIISYKDFLSSVRYSEKKRVSYKQLSDFYYSLVVCQKIPKLFHGAIPSYTYIYTDYGQQVNFSSIDQNIVFDSTPYYLFAHWAGNGSVAVIDEEWTSICKQMSDIIFLINPIVYDSAIKCCQWSAFFRYVKENYPDEWRSFKADVRRLKYDAPEVVTPIDFHR